MTRPPGSGRRLRVPPFNWLRAFEAASRHMSFTGAANELGVTQAAVSQQVKQLEDYLGAPLFKRLAKKLEQTDQGRAYMPVVQASFEQLGANTFEIFGAERLHGPVSLRVTTSLTYVWLVPRLERFLAAHPDISLRLTTTVDGGEFGSPGVDLETRYGDGSWPGVEAVKLFDEYLLPVCAPALAAGPPKLSDPAELADHVMIHVIGEPENWQMWFDAVGVPGITGRQSLQFDLHMNATHAAIAGAGVALGLWPVVGDALRDGLLVAPFEQRIRARDAHYVVTLDGGEPRPEARVFLDWLMGEAARDRQMADAAS